MGEDVDHPPAEPIPAAPDASAERIRFTDIDMVFRPNRRGNERMDELLQPSFDRRNSNTVDGELRNSLQRGVAGGTDVPGSDQARIMAAVNFFCTGMNVREAQLAAVHNMTVSRAFSTAHAVLYAGSRVNHRASQLWSRHGRMMRSPSIGAYFNERCATFSTLIANITSDEGSVLNALCSLATVLVPVSFCCDSPASLHIDTGLQNRILRSAPHVQVVAALFQVIEQIEDENRAGNTEESAREGTDVHPHNLSTMMANADNARRVEYIWSNQFGLDQESPVGAAMVPPSSMQENAQSDESLLPINSSDDAQGHGGHANTNIPAVTPPVVIQGQTSGMGVTDGVAGLARWVYGNGEEPSAVNASTPAPAVEHPSTEHHQDGEADQANVVIEHPDAATPTGGESRQQGNRSNNRRGRR
jgi:hypothetical protein